MKARVTLRRPAKGKAAPAPIGTPVLDWPAAVVEPIGTPVVDLGPVTPPPPGPKRKAWRALRTNRPKLLEPLPDDADLFKGLQRSKTTLWLLMVGVSVTLHVHSGGVLGAMVFALGAVFLGCGPRGWNPWRSGRLFGC